MKKISYVIIGILAFVIGTQFNTDLKTSQVITSDDIAVVNDDQRQDYLDGTVKFGNDFVQQIEDKQSAFNFTTTNSAEASQGMVSGKYGATITIPSNFTKGILSINSEKPTKTSITYKLNEKLTPTKSQKMETEIVKTISDFESNITYMYVYSIFDGLHSTQDGVETVAENAEPVYVFLEEIKQVDIVGNHDYKLKDNNTDSFDSIDISKQLAEFQTTVENYKQEVGSVIEVYQDENDNFSTLVDEAITTMDDNDQLLNDRIANVEDTLQSIVDTDTKYTEDEYSITDSKGMLTQIILEYLSQLQIVNNVYDQNEKTLSDSKDINDYLGTLENNDQYRNLITLIEARNNYYQDLDKIVNSCLKPGVSEEEAATCYSDASSNYNSDYSSYQSILDEFDKEKSYYQTMTYYLSNIGTVVASDSKTEGTPKTFSQEIEPAPTAKLDQQVEEAVTPTFSLTSYGEGMTGSDNIIQLQLTDLQTTSEMSIAISDQTNISSIEFVSPTTNEVKVTNSSIDISNINSDQLNLYFNVQKQDENSDSSLSLSYGEEQVSVTVGSKNPITISSTYNQEEDQIVLDYTVSLEQDGQVVEITDDQLIDVDNTEVSGSDSELVTVTKGGLEIDGSEHKSGDVLEFSLTVPNTIGTGTVVNTYQINDTEYSDPIIVGDPPIDKYLVVQDDSYQIIGDSIEINPDSDDDNDDIEPSEDTALKYSLDYTAASATPITSLSFDVGLPTEVFTEFTASTDSLFVNVKTPDENQIYYPQVNVDTNRVTLDFTDGVVPTLNDEGLYEADFTIYINTKAKDDIDLSESYTSTLDYDGQASINNLTIGYTDSSSLDTGISVPGDINLAVGEPVLASVDYLVNDGSVCKGKTLADCEFEAGENITRTITLTNDSNHAAAGIVLTDVLSDKLNQITDTTDILDASLTTLDGSTKYNPDDYVTLIKGDDSSSAQITLPENSQLTLVTDLTVNQAMSSGQTVYDTVSLSQYQIAIYSATAEFSIAPLKLKVSVDGSQQMTEDGVITPNEAVDITLTLRNNSTRGSTNRPSIEAQYDSGLISSIQVLSIEDDKWNPIDSYTTSGNKLTINHQLAANKAFRIKIRVRFNNLSGASSNTEIKFIPYIDSPAKYDDTTSDKISFILSTSTNYLELAQEQAASGTVMGDKTYHESMGFTEEVLNIHNQLVRKFNKMRRYIGKYIDLDEQLAKFTTEDNTSLDTIASEIKEFGLGYSSDDDENPLTDYEYCSANPELSCQLYDLYNQIFSKEKETKAHYLDILNKIDPSNEEQLGTKPTDNNDDPVEPSNIGADFNGYGECKNIVGDVPDDEQPECEHTELGINERIDMQQDNIGLVKDKIDLILDNQLKEINEDPYKQKLGTINDDASTEMSKVESKNNELFGKKIDIYNENYDRVMKYVEEISKDPEYTKAIKKFTKEEDVRQEESKLILENVYNLLPNTYLDGIPNKLVYSFIASPFEITESNQDTAVTTITESNHPTVLLVISALAFIMAGLIGALYWINREV